jgi:hypothetical protein
MEKAVQCQAHFPVVPEPEVQDLEGKCLEIMATALVEAPFQACQAVLTQEKREVLLQVLIATGTVSEVVRFLVLLLETVKVMAPVHSLRLWQMEVVVVMGPVRFQAERQEKVQVLSKQTWMAVVSEFML